MQQKQGCSREEMQGGINSLLNPNSSSSSSSSQISLIPDHLQNHQIQTPPFDSISHDDFLEQMLSTIPSSCSWPDLKSPWELNLSPALAISNSNSKPLDLSDDSPLSLPETSNVAFHDFDESLILASKLRQHQISADGPAVAAAKLMLQQQLMMAAARGGLSHNDVVDGSSFNSPAQVGDGAVYNGFGGGSMQQSQQSQQHFQAQSMVKQGEGASQGGQASGAPAQPRQRVRARRGQAIDPHSIAERLRRERIAERMKALQELVPNANKTDKASMLDEIIDYVKFLQLQVKVLSMSRLGGAAAVAPLVADISSEGGGDCLQVNTSNGGSLPRTSNGNQTSSSNDTLTVTEHQVAKLMEEDMGSAMQYLQGKGLCLMPISLATAISTATCHTRSSPAVNHHNLHHTLLQSNGVDGPSSPSVSNLTVQSATIGNGGIDASVKDGASVSKP